LLLLDEPSLGLSPILIEQVFTTVARIHADGVPVLPVEQTARMALSVSRHGYILENGEISCRGRRRSWRVIRDVRAAYLGG
jgi:branched-chain amino acid transport system ATP-binding protein